MTSGQLAQEIPVLSVSKWVQGGPTNFGKLLGQVVLLEVFQVNCPGCFLYSLPQAIEMYNRYSQQGLAVLGVATAFEDFDKNTLENLKMLLQTGCVVGETLQALTERRLLENGRWLHRMPFPVAMDRLVENQQPIGEAIVEQYIQDHIPHFYQQSAAEQQQLKQRIFCYLQQQKYTPQTFNRFALQGTPSHILVDKQGRLRHSKFGFFPELEMCIQQLLAENA